MQLSMKLGPPISAGLRLTYSGGRHSVSLLSHPAPSGTDLLRLCWSELARA